MASNPVAPSSAVKKMAVSRNGPNNLASGPGTTGPIISGQSKQVMNFTTYDQGFGTQNTNGGNSLAQSVIGKTSRQELGPVPVASTSASRNQAQAISNS